MELIRLSNFWLPLLWVLGAGLMLQYVPKNSTRIGGQACAQWSWFAALVLVTPLILWAGSRNSMGDTYAYMRKFDEVPAALAELPEYLAVNTKDQGFSVMIGLCKWLGIRHYSGFFMLVAIIQLICMTYVFRKYAPDFWICIFLFVASTDYISWMFNGMRQFLATTIMFAGFGLMVRKRYIAFSILVFLASRIHESALLMLLLAYIMHGPAMNVRTILMILAVALMIPFVDRFTPILSDMLEDTQYSGMTSDEIWTTDDGTNLIRVLVYSIPALIALVGRRYIRGLDDPVMNLCINGALVTMAIYIVSAFTSGIYIGRLPIYTTFYGYMALPWLIDRIFEKSSAVFVKLVMVACYAAFYYYQLGIHWGML